MLSYSTDGGTSYETKAIRFDDFADDIDLGDLKNVSATSPTTGQLLEWNGTSWEPADAGAGPFSIEGRSETLTAASFTSSTSYNTTIGSLYYTHDSGYIFFYGFDSTAVDFLEDMATLGSGDELTIDGNTITVASSNTFPLAVVNGGQLGFNTDETGPGGEGGFASTGSIPLSAFSVSITGSSDPLFDSTYDVTIDGVTYAGGTWTVSGTGATATLTSNPGLASGDTLTQANRISYTQAGTATRLANFSDLPANATASAAGLLSSEFYEKIYYGLNFNDDSSAVDRAVISTDKDTRDRYNVYMQENNCYDNVILGTRLVKDLGSNDAESIQNTVAIGSNLLGYPAASTTQANDFEESVIIGMSAAGKFGGTLETVAIGYKALEGGTTFNNGGADLYPHNLTGNTGLGTYAGQNLVQGLWNTCIGHSAGRNIREAANNTFLGRSAGTALSPSGNIQDSNNVICLGDNNIANAYIKVSWTVTSDGRDKADITDLAEGLDFIKALRPVTYKWDERDKYLPEDEPENPDFVMPSILDMTPDGTHKGTQTDVGFIAQEVEAVEKQFGWANTCDDALLTQCTKDHTRMGIKYERLIPMMVNAIKELSDKNDALLARIEALES